MSGGLLTIAANASLVDFALVIAAAFATAVLSGLTGFGGGLLMPAVVAPVVGIREVAPVLAVAQLINNASRVNVYWGGLDKGATTAVLCAAIPAVAIGTLVYASLPVSSIALVLGLFMLISIPLRRRLDRHNITVGRAGLAGAGAAYGFASGMLSGVGMMMVAVLLGAGLSGPALLATDAAIAVGVNGAKASLFAWNGLLSWPAIVAGLLIGICGIPGNYLARYLLHRFALKIHTLIMEGLVVLGALTLLWRAFN